MKGGRVFESLNQNQDKKNRNTSLLVSQFVSVFADVG